MTEAHKHAVRERLVIVGNVGASTFEPWIKRHAAKLGLTGLVCCGSASRFELEADGLADMFDVMAVGCLLGPAEVWVESVERTRLTNW